MKNISQGINSRLRSMEIQINNLEDRLELIIQDEKKKENNFFFSNMRVVLETSGITSRVLTMHYISPEGEQRDKAKNLFEEMTAENFP